MDSQSPLDYTVKQGILERQRFHKALHVKNNEDALGMFAVDSMRGEVDYNVNFNDWVIRMEMDVLAEHLVDHFYEEEIEVRLPNSWWDLLVNSKRETWWGRWLNKWYTPKYHSEFHKIKVKVERWVKYPAANESFPRFGQAVPFERLERIYD